MSYYVACFVMGYAACYVACFVDVWNYVVDSFITLVNEWTESVENW